MGKGREHNSLQSVLEAHGHPPTSTTRALLPPKPCSPLSQPPHVAPLTHVGNSSSKAAPEPSRPCPARDIAPKGTARVPDTPRGAEKIHLASALATSSAAAGSLPARTLHRDQIVEDRSLTAGKSHKRGKSSSKWISLQKCLKTNKQIGENQPWGCPPGTSVKQCQHWALFEHSEVLGGAGGGDRGSCRVNPEH